MCEIALGSVLIGGVVLIGVFVGGVLSLPARLLGVHKVAGVSPEAMQKFIMALSAIGAVLYFVLTWK